MPHEFWREVVDRVAAEVPGTLLLAEAFWLMEGYFVRTLGMHRVYNSAFMNMMRDEENEKYRSVIKKTLEFDPDIMKRYVNFMSNPDERTAVDQFGTGDKCFGVAAMMSTLPGLPMFGHGQVEGFTEKYGMEYRRPRYDETPDQWLVDRHQREIAPLLHHSVALCGEPQLSALRLLHQDGTVDENVFAYSNRRGGERGLFLYNNRYGTARGTIHRSASYADKGSGQQRQQQLSNGLELSGDAAIILRYRDSLTGLQYLKRANKVEQEGMSFELHAYQCHIFVNWQELRSTAEKPWDRLCDQLNGSGVADLDEALINLELRPVHDALRRVLDPAVVIQLADVAEASRAAVGSEKLKNLAHEREAFFETAWKRCDAFMRLAQPAYAARRADAMAAKPIPPGLMAEEFRERIRGAMRIPALESHFPAPWTAGARRVLPSPSPKLTATAMWGPVLSWCILELLAETIDPLNPEPAAMDLFDRLRLRQPLGQTFAALGFEKEENWRVAGRIKVALLLGSGIAEEQELAAVAVKDAVATAKVLQPETAVPKGAETKPILTPALWQDPDVRWLTGAHEAEGHTYFLKESYEDLLWWLQLPVLSRLAGERMPDRKAFAEMSSAVADDLAAAEAAGYRLEILLKSYEPEITEAPESKAAPEVHVEARSDDSKAEAGEDLKEQQAEPARTAEEDTAEVAPGETTKGSKV